MAGARPSEVSLKDRKEGTKKQTKKKKKTGRNETLYSSGMATVLIMTSTTQIRGWGETTQNPEIETKNLNAPVARRAREKDHG